MILYTMQFITVLCSRIPSIASINKNTFNVSIYHFNMTPSRVSEKYFYLDNIMSTFASYLHIYFIIVNIHLRLIKLHFEPLKKLIILCFTTFGIFFH